MVSFNISENVFCADCTSTASLTAAQPVGEAAQKTFWDILNDTTDNTPCNRAARKKSKTVAHAAVVTSRPYKAKIEGKSKRKKAMDISKDCSPILTKKTKKQKMQKRRRSVILTVHSKMKHPACNVNKNTVIPVIQHVEIHNLV